MGIKITRDTVLRVVSITLASLVLYYDYLYVDQLVKEFDLFMANRTLLKLWITGAVGYFSVNLLAFYVVKWSWLK